MNLSKESLEKVLNQNGISRKTFINISAAAGVMASLPSITGCTADSPAKDIACSIVIIGGGAAGISVAARLLKQLKKAKITVVDPSEKHFYQPGFTFIGAGIWQGDDVWMKQEDLMPKGVDWKRTKVTMVEPDKNTVVLADSSRIKYDFLVLAPGLQENWSLIEGITKATLGAGNAHSIYDFEGSQKTWKAVNEFTRKGGRGIFTDTWTKHKCGGAPKKICLLTEHLSRKRNTRKNLSFNYFTGSKVLYDVPHYTPRLEEIYKERDIPVRVRSRLKAVDTAAKKAYFIDRNTNETFTEDYDFLHFAPPQSAPDFVKQSGLSWTEGKLAPEGWAMVDKQTLIHLKWKNIISLGDVAGIPTSKTSAAIRKQVPIAVENLSSIIAGKEPSCKYDGYAACPIITDYGHLLMAEFDYEKKCAQSFPFSLLDTTKEIRTGWWLKRFVLKPMYFHLMLRGLV
jgi:sulfide:quinone oxidoreductase